jgi:hypothetical protein
MWPRRHPGCHGRLGNRRRNPADQTRIEGIRDQILRTEIGVLFTIRLDRISDCSTRASSAMARTAASFIASVIVVAPTSRAPRKMKGKHSTLLT